MRTKIIIYNSNPKAYNLVKMLEFLSGDRSMIMFYFVGVHPGTIVKTTLLCAAFRGKAEHYPNPHSKRYPTPCLPAAGGQG